MEYNKSWESLKEIGNSFFKQSNFIEAINYYEKAIEINNSIDILYSNKGTCEKCLKKYKESIKDYQTALKINPNNSKNLNRLASVFIIIGNLTEAKKIQQKVLTLEPNNLKYKEQMNIINYIINDDILLNQIIKNNNFIDAEKELWRIHLPAINVKNYI